MKHLRKGSAMVLGLLWLLMADLATAGDYEIIVGKGVEVCEACLQNLLRQTAEEAVCERRYALELGFGQPDWNMLDLEKQVELYKRVANLTDKGKEDLPTPDLGNRKERDEFIRVKQQTLAVLSETHIDIDNDGQRDHVLRYQSANCHRQFQGLYTFYKSALLVVVGDQRAIDYPKTDLLMQYPLLEDLKAKRGDTWRGGLSYFQMYQVFTYKGLVYFDRWDGGGGPDINTLSIYVARAGQASRVCQVRLFPPDDVPHN